MQVVNPSPTAMYSGISNAMVTISRVEGFRTLWKGLSSVILGAGSSHGRDTRISGTDATQGRRMLSISRPTKPPNMPSVATREAARRIIHSQLVGYLDVKDLDIY